MAVNILKRSNSSYFICSCLEFTFLMLFNSQTLKEMYEPDLRRNVQVSLHNGLDLSTLDTLSRNTMANPVHDGDKPAQNLWYCGYRTWSKPFFSFLMLMYLYYESFWVPMLVPYSSLLQEFFVIFKFYVCDYCLFWHSVLFISSLGWMSVR